MVTFLKTLTETITIKNMKLTSNLVYLNEKLLILVECYISLKRSWKRWFNVNVSENVNWDYYHQKISNMVYNNEKIIDDFDVLYIVNKVLKRVNQ